MGKEVTSQSRSALTIPREEVKRRIQSQIEKAQNIPNVSILENYEAERWHDFTAELLRQVCSTDELTDEFTGRSSISIGGEDISVGAYVKKLRSISDRLELYPVQLSDFTSDSTKKNPPKVFISYKWQDKERNAWVERLYNDLRTKHGIDAQLDKYEVDFGESFSVYMTSRIDRECEAMLFVITPAAVQAVDVSHSGGVHFEMQIANARKLKEPEEFRIIGIYREGNKNTAYLKDQRYIDFRDDSLYEQNLKELADSLWGRRTNHP